MFDGETDQDLVPEPEDEVEEGEQGQGGGRRGRGRESGASKHVIRGQHLMDQCPRNSIRLILTQTRALNNAAIKCRLWLKFCQLLNYKIL